MKGRLAVHGQYEDREAAALLVDGRLDDLLIDPPSGGPPLPGTIFLATADRPMKGQGGQLLHLPDRGRAFLRNSPGLAPGRAITVQVTGYAETGKAVPVTAKLIFKGRFAILTPGAPGVNVSRRITDENRRAALVDAIGQRGPAGMGVILRSAAEFADTADIIGEISELRTRAASVAETTDQSPARLFSGPGAHTCARLEWPTNARTDTRPSAFADHGIDDLISAIRSPLVQLAGGASAWIEPTRALVAIDVNTGGDTTPAAGLKANIALCRDLGRQLRCRGLGGQITIDFAPFAKRDRRQIEQALRKALRADPVETALVGWTPLGHFELQRKRERMPIPGLAPI